MKGFHPLSIKMAKEQGLPLNPSRISGVCGRIKCCMAYEFVVYKELSRALPRVGDKISADELLAEVRSAAGELLRDVRIFDIYTGDGIEKGLKSVALGLILQETSSTLTELEIERVSSAVVERLSSKFNASIRE